MEEVQSKSEELDTAPHALRSVMDGSNITTRVAEIRREIAEMRNANRIYQSRTRHRHLEISLHETRRQRLQEIVIELEVLLRGSAK